MTPARLEAVRRGAARQRVQGMLLTDPLSIRYLAGVRDARWALVTPHAAWIMPYALSWAAIRGQAGWPWRVLPPTPGSGGLLGCLRRAGVARLGFEGDTLGWSAAERLRRDVARVCVTSGLEGIVAAVRIVKDAAEREVLARAAAIAAGAGAALPWIIRTGMSEREAASRLDQRMRALGAEGPAFDTIILFGANAALPHGIPGDRRLRRGDLVLVDWGARLDGYHSDMTRVFAAGRPTAAQRAAYRAVWRSYTRARAVVRDGVPAEVPDAAARRALGARAATFMHSLGHGVGLAIHEDPRLGRGMRGRLRTGMVVTVEPGIYLPGWGGIRLEDTVVVTPAGAVSLTGAPAAELPLIATR